MVTAATPAPAPPAAPKPKPRGRPFQPGHQFSKLGGLASVKSRRLKAELRKAAREAQTPDSPTTAETAIRVQMRLVKEQIARTRAVLSDDAGTCPHCGRTALEPHHRAQLLKSLDVLLDRQRKLLGISDPGPTKPPQQLAPAGAWSAGMFARPIQAVVTPAPAPAQLPPPAPAPEPIQVPPIREGQD